MCLRIISIIFLNILFACTSLVDGRVWPGHYTDAHRNLHRLVEAKTHSHLQDFQIAIPFRVDNNYRFVSHVVQHKPRNRVRRDVAEENTLRFSVLSFGEEFQIHIEPNHRLLTPKFLITKMKNKVERKMDSDINFGCHYRGWVTSHEGGAVSMSTCKGLTGVLRTAFDDILIEPVQSGLNHSFDHPLHPHIIYKRRHLNKNKHGPHFCGRKHYHPVAIPRSPGNLTVQLLSDGEIELESIQLQAKQRNRRSLTSRESRGDRESFIISQRERPPRKTVETLVVVDRELIRNHERDNHDVTTYVLTVMNMVSGLFSDHSLDNKVDISLIGLILLEDESGLELNHKADRSLTNFCEWQYKLNHTRRGIPDHSILLTGIDICIHSNRACETLGLAQIGGMCNRRYSCTVNEDLGLGLAFTVAHETGHSFGMRHDGQQNSCTRREGHIMSPTLNGRNGVFTWSECSREKLNSFLDLFQTLGLCQPYWPEESEATFSCEVKLPPSGYLSRKHEISDKSQSSMCLDTYSEGTEDFILPARLPGEIYDANIQCRWQFGYGTSLCHFRYNQSQVSICKVLWCQRGGRSTCTTKYMPAAEGTACGNNMFCRRGSCVPVGSNGPTAVDGSWAAYGPWSSCTRSCGGGVHFRKRTCTNPAPNFGGRFCSGKSKVYKICNIEKCPPSNIDFRGQQCASFNSKPYRRRFYNWVPFTKYSNFGRSSCDLLCKAEGFGFFDILADKVTDGTTCKENSLDVCIDGACQHVGCDYVLDSDATYDICGVCNGNNSTCDVINGEFDGPIDGSGYYEVVRIPHGARNIQVREKSCCTHSYIAVKSALSSQYYLNGNWRIDLNALKSFAGVEWDYYRHGFDAEILSTVEQLQEDIIIEVLVIAENPGITFSYSLPKMNQNVSTDFPLKPRNKAVFYFWNISYGECSTTCGEGFMSASVSCMRDDGTLVEETSCDVTSQPNTTKRQCQLQPCPSKWEVTAWGECSLTCGRGIKSRQVFCKLQSGERSSITLDSDCIESKKPKLVQKCKVSSCPAEWKVGLWSKCSRKCGRGIKRRKVHCDRNGRKIRASRCDRSTKPRRKDRCVIKKCKRNYRWRVNNWSECSSTCGRGTQRRQLRCSYKVTKSSLKYVGSRRCKQIIKPKLRLKRKCNNFLCDVETLSSKLNERSRNFNVFESLHMSRPPSAVWITGRWEKCSMTCGGGKQTRKVDCLRGGNISKLCNENKRPLSERSCNNYKCSLSAGNEQGFQCLDNFTWCDLVPQHGQCAHSYFGKQCCKACLASS